MDNEQQSIYGLWSMGPNPTLLASGTHEEVTAAIDDQPLEARPMCTGLIDDPPRACESDRRKGSRSRYAAADRS